MAEQHKFQKPRRLPWVFCAKCGIVALKNRACQKVVEAECRNNRWEDGDYEVTQTDGKPGQFFGGRPNGA